MFAFLFFIWYSVYFLLKWRATVTLFYIASLIIVNAFLYKSNIALHLSRSCARFSSSCKSSPNNSSLYNAATSRFCTDSRELLTRRCMIALGTRSWMVWRVISKYDVIKEPIGGNPAISQHLDRDIMTACNDRKQIKLTNQSNFKLVSVQTLRRLLLIFNG